jgi:hypothetical protein
MKPIKATLALLASSCFTLPAAAAVFNLSTLDEHKSGSTIQGWYAPGTNTKIFSNTVNQVLPWTVDAGLSDQASLNFVIPGMGNQGGKTYMTSGGQFPIPPGQTLGALQSGFSGEFQQANGFPVYFAFSNPTYDFNNPACFCNSITPVQVEFDSFQTIGNVQGMVVTAYSDDGVTPIPGDTFTLTGNSGTTPQTFNFDWTGVAYVSISPNGQGGVYFNNIDVNEGLATGAPEPSTWAMMLAGFGLLGFAAMRKGKREARLAV